MATSRYRLKRVDCSKHPKQNGKTTGEPVDMESVTDGGWNELDIRAAEQSDIDSLINVHKAAFANDNATRLMFKDENDYTAQLRSMLDSQISASQCSFIKAVKTNTHEIVGWLGARIVGYGTSDRGESTSDGGRNGIATTEHISLRASIKESFAQMRMEWLPGKKYIHVETLVTHPAQQGQGIGPALLAVVIKKANEEGILCWVESTPAARNVYIRAGFRDVGHLNIDLGEYAPGGKHGRRGWGDYEFWYMLRLPDAKVQKSLPAGSGDRNHVDEH